MGGMDCDEELPISVRVCPAGRERDPSTCRASCLTPRGDGSAAAGSAAASSSGSDSGGCNVNRSPLLFPGLPSEVSSSPAVVVSKKLWILLVPAKALSSRRFFSRLIAAPKAYVTGGDVYPTDSSQ